MRYADGKLGWLTTGYDEARVALDDQHFSNRMEAGASPPIEELGIGQGDQEFPSPPPGDFLAMDDPEHAYYRRLVRGQFTTGRMQQLEPRITEIVQEHLEQMARSAHRWAWCRRSRCRCLHWSSASCSECPTLTASAFRAPPASRSTSTSRPRNGGTAPRTSWPTSWSWSGMSLLLPAINRDPERFPHPDRLDLTRSAGTRLAFGHRVHQCLGQQLARTELRIACPALLRRFPTLKLAVRRRRCR
jgi:cytochrome P450